MIGRKSQRGNAMVEFALSFSLITTLFFGTFRFGYTFYVYNLMQSQVRDGCRYAALRSFRAADAASIEAYKQKVRNMVRFSTPDGSGTAIVPGLTDANVVVTIVDQFGNNADDTHVPANVSVTIHNFSVNAVISTFNFDQKPYLQFNYVGRYAPAETES